MTKLGKHLLVEICCCPSCRSLDGSLHRMLLWIMGSEGVTALLPSLHLPSPCPLSLFYCFFFFFWSFCSSLPYLFPSSFFFSTLSLTLLIFTPSTSLSSNVCPVCLTRGHRMRTNLSQGQTDSTNRLLRTLAAVSRTGILSHYADVRLIFTLQKQHINLPHKVVAMWLCCHNK